MSALQRRQFHGTPNAIDDTHIRPASHTGATAASSRGFSSGGGRPAHTDLAFSTHSEDEAWGYAINTGRRLKEHPENSDPDPRHRSRVYEVEPAHDQHQEGGKHGEIQSETGFRIKGEQLHKRGETGTFPQINWNAFKPTSPASPRHVASDQDMNHSYMQDQSNVEKAPHTPAPYDEAATDHDNRYRAPDSRHPDQVNLYTGHTVAEHKTYENVPGFQLHMNPEQFPQAEAMHRDPTTSVIRARKHYAGIDREMGTTK